MAVPNSLREVERLKVKQRRVAGKVVGLLMPLLHPKHIRECVRRKGENRKVLDPCTRGGMGYGCQHRGSLAAVKRVDDAWQRVLYEACLQQENVNGRTCLCVSCGGPCAKEKTDEGQLSGKWSSEQMSGESQIVLVARTDPMKSLEAKQTPLYQYRRRCT